MINPDITLPQLELAEFCKKWSIVELAVFGSAVRTDFRTDSDIDVLVKFSSRAEHSLFDIVHMEDELRSLLGREVDLVEKTAIEQSRNYLRRRAILGSAEVVYAG